MLGQSPLTRVHCGGGGARSLARSRALVVAGATVVAVGHAARDAPPVRRASRARAHARHHRTSRASSPFIFTPRAHSARCDGGGARSLDSARGVWRLRWRWRGVGSVRGQVNALNSDKEIGHVDPRAKAF